MSGSDEVSVELSETTAGTPGAGPRVFLAESALEAINRHAMDESHHEIGGVLIGTVTEGPEPCVVVEDIILGTEMRHSGASVTFTHETWDQINAVKDAEFADKRIVGWYHSHPGFGIFLSGHDLFIHENFFSAPWQIAVVTDPRARTWGCFTWNNGKLEQDGGYMLYRLGFTTARGGGAPEPPVAEVAGGCPPPLPRPNRGAVWATAALAMLLAGLLAANLANFAILSRLQARTDRHFADIESRIDALPAALAGRAEAPVSPEKPQGRPVPDTPTAGVDHAAPAPDKSDGATSAPPEPQGGAAHAGSTPGS